MVAFLYKTISKLSPTVASSFNSGIKCGFPIIVGYFPVAMAFGLLSRNTGLTFRDSSFFSLFVFAGASQFMALDLIMAGTAFGNIIFATFLLNLRHIMMSASLSTKTKDIKKKWLPFIAFGVTDETFSVSSLGGVKPDAAFLVALHTSAYSSWVLGTLTGYLAGSVLPAILQSSLGIGLYAMFAALLAPEMKKSRNVLVLSAVSGIIYFVIDFFKIIPQGWSLVTAILVASMFGAVFLREGAER